MTLRDGTTEPWGGGHQDGAGGRAEASGLAMPLPRDGARDLEALARASPCRVRSIRAVSRAASRHRVRGRGHLRRSGGLGTGAKIARRHPGDVFWTWLTVAQVTAGAQALLDDPSAPDGPAARSGWSLRGHPTLHLRLSAVAALRVRTRGCEGGHRARDRHRSSDPALGAVRVGLLHQLRAHPQGVDDRAGSLAAEPHGCEMMTSMRGWRRLWSGRWSCWRSPVSARLRVAYEPFPPGFGIRLPFPAPIPARARRRSTSCAGLSRCSSRTPTRITWGGRARGDWLLRRDRAD